MPGLEIHRGISELTAPATEPVTTAEAKLWMNVDISSDDTMIDAMIAAARLQAEIFTRRAFVARQLRTTWDDFPGGRRDTLSTLGSRSRLLLPAAPLLFLKQIVYTDSDGTSQTLGDAVMEIRVTPATVENTDIFVISAAGVAISTFTATAGTVANVTAGLTSNWNSSTSDYATYVTAVDQTTYVELRGGTGQGFAVTTSTTDGGGADTQTLTAATINDESTLYTVDAASEPARIEPVITESWPSTQDDINAVQADFVAGYGAASAVPENAKSAIKMMVADLYEHREAQLEIKVEHNMAVRNLLWGLRVLNVY